MVDVDQAVGRASSSPPLEARLAGRTVRFQPDAPTLAAADAYRMVMDNHDDVLRQVIAVVDFLDAACLPADREALADALHDPATTGEHVGALFAWLCGEYRLSTLAEQAKRRRARQDAAERAARWGEVAS